MKVKRLTNLSIINLSVNISKAIYNFFPLLLFSLHLSSPSISTLMGVYHVYIIPNIRTLCRYTSVGYKSIISTTTNKSNRDRKDYDGKAHGVK